MNSQAMVRTLVAVGISALSACDSKSGAPGGNATPQPPTLTFTFFDGESPLPPSQWTSVPPPREAEADLALLASLYIKDVLKKRRQDQDPTLLLLENTNAILALGRAGRIPVKWNGDVQEGGEHYLDYIVLPDSQKISGVELAGYFNAIAAAARAGALQDHEGEQELSSALLAIGYNIFKSDSSIGSERPRLLVLMSGWNAAFALREQRAASRDDTAGANEWKTRGQELDQAMKEMFATNIRKRGG